MVERVELAYSTSDAIPALSRMDNLAREGNPLELGTQPGAAQSYDRLHPPARGPLDAASLEQRPVHAVHAGDLDGLVAGRGRESSSQFVPSALVADVYAWDGFVHDVVDVGVSNLDEVVEPVGSKEGT